MKHPTIQLLLDFAKHSVWPFWYSGDHSTQTLKRLNLVITKLKIGLSDPLGPYQLEQIYREYFSDSTTAEPTEQNLRKFVELVFEVRQQFGDMLTTAALKDLQRQGLAPSKKPSGFMLG